MLLRIESTTSESSADKTTTPEEVKNPPTKLDENMNIIETAEAMEIEPVKPLSDDEGNIHVSQFL